MPAMLKRLYETPVDNYCRATVLTIDSPRPTAGYKDMGGILKCYRRPDHGSQLLAVPCFEHVET